MWKDSSKVIHLKCCSKGYYKIIILTAIGGDRGLPLSKTPKVDEEGRPSGCCMQ